MASGNLRRRSFLITMLIASAARVAAQDLTATASAGVIAEGFTNTGGYRLPGGGQQQCSAFPCNLSMPLGSAKVGQSPTPNFDGEARVSMALARIDVSGSIRVLAGGLYTNASYSAGGSQSIFARVPLGSQLRITLAGTGTSSVEDPQNATVTNTRLGSQRSQSRSLAAFSQTYTVTAGPQSVQVGGETYYFVDEIFAGATAGASAQSGTTMPSASFSGSVSLEIHPIGRIMRKNSPDGIGTAADTRVAPPLKVLVLQGETGAPLAQVPVTFRFAEPSTLGGSLNPTEATTGAEGTATTALTVGPPGLYNVVARCDSCIPGFDEAVFSIRAFRGIIKTVPNDKPIPDRTCIVQILPLGRLLVCGDPSLDLECTGTRDSSDPSCIWTTDPPASISINTGDTPRRKAIFQSPATGDFNVRVDYSVPFAGCHASRTVSVRRLVIEEVQADKYQNFQAGAKVRVKVLFSGAGGLDPRSLIELEESPKGSGVLAPIRASSRLTPGIWEFDVRFLKTPPFDGVRLVASACGSEKSANFLGASAPQLP